MLSSEAQMAANQVERRTLEKVGLSEQHTATSWRLEVRIKVLADSVSGGVSFPACRGPPSPCELITPSRTVRNEHWVLKAPICSTLLRQPATGSLPPYPLYVRREYSFL